MLIEESVTMSAIASEVDQASLVNGATTNKRKPITATIANKVAADVSKSVKMRKMNDENLDPAVDNTIFDSFDMSVSNVYCKSNSARDSQVGTFYRFQV